jgi:integrase
LPLTLNEKSPLGIYLADWVQRIEPTLRASTYRRYCELARHITRYSGKIPLTQLTPSHVERMYATLQRPIEAGGAALSSTTALHVHTCLHKALADAEREGLLARNVADIVHAPRQRLFEPTIWTLKEVREFLHAAKQDRLGPLYILAAYTGLRSGELRALRWQDVDLEAKRLHVRTALMRGNVVGQPKTRKGRRSVELSAFAVAALRTQREQQDRERQRLGDEWQGTGLVFTSIVGTALDGTNVLHAFYRFCDRAGLPRVRIHDLRHLQATLLLVGGINLKVVADRLGHSHINVTLDTYSHVVPTMQREAADMLDRLLGEWDVLESED